MQYEANTIEWKANVLIDDWHPRIHDKLPVWMELEIEKFIDAWDKRVESIRMIYDCDENTEIRDVETVLWWFRP